MRLDLNQAIANIKQFKRGASSEHKALARTMRGLIEETVNSVVDQLARAAGTSISVRVGKSSKLAKSAKRVKRTKRAKRTKREKPTAE